MTIIAIAIGILIVVLVFTFLGFSNNKEIVTYQNQEDIIKEDIQQNFQEDIIEPPKEQEIKEVHNTTTITDVALQNPPKNDEEIQLLVNKGQKIQAIKLYREKYNVGLKEAKDAVENMFPYI
jgi:ribosomal protein L7/L12